MPEQNPPITTLLDLLEILYIDPLFGDYRKTGARVHYWMPGEPEVREYFDDGHGHSGAFSQETIPLDRMVFREALEKEYIAGVLKPGYVSTTEFKLTNAGKKELFRLHAEMKEQEQNCAP